MKNQQPLLIGNQEYNNLNVYKLRTSDRSPNYFLNKLKYINDCLNRNEVDKASDIISKEVDSLVNEYAKVRPHILIQIGNQGDGYNGTTRFHAIPLSSGNMNKIDLNYKSSVVELDGLGYALGYKQSVTTEKGVGLWYNSNNKVQQVTKEQFKEILDATNEFNQEGYNMNLNFHNMKSSIREDFDELRKGNEELRKGNEELIKVNHDLMSKLDNLQKEVSELKDEIHNSQLENLEEMEY